jgi:hypothetical protein
MNGDLKDKAASGLKRTWCTSWTFAVNTARRAKILGRYGLACWQQYKIRRALANLGTQIVNAVERGEDNPMAAPDVGTALQRANELKEIKEKNYQTIEEIRDSIRSSCVIPTPDEPGGIEENPPVP